MDTIVAWPCRVSVIPSETEIGCFRWVIRGSDGALVARSPYAFVTALGAELSADLWLREIEAHHQPE
ncbi:hypothetical protein Q8W71_07845 [Methylobacterium sp. NEAU 140]|uniref:hypothetical protein n=1 Tax=Methylobacterium sp. NEAU 140 TaxID=3064945 RepID=UPI002732CFBF|nr:hypothetical protein [Methylobacterium sp. NEAU 140]MDP4022531.1 hypothetical protein [Methylobacterium sp. NEAU 140]